MNEKDFYKWDSHEQDGREVIHEWSQRRRAKLQGFGKSKNKLLIYAFDIDTLKSFIKNFNFMVIIQMLLAALSVYVFDYFNIAFDFHVSLFVSPIVFPLAFSINTDFQRREKVLEDLANFKAAAMLWFFCMREWRDAAELNDAWLNAVHNKVKNMMFNLREYLLTHKLDRRRFIGRCMYEDFSDTNQLIERVRASKLPANTSIISRVIHLLNMLCLSFERLRVVREYRSPRSIRSFNKVLIFFLPIILSPYFIYLGRKEDSNIWCKYYIAVLVAGVFGALQGVQDKLDDPFDGMSEDDIKLDTIDEWTFHSLENIVNRTFQVGRFHVSANIDQADSAVNRVRSTTLHDTMSIPTSPPPTKGGAFNHFRRKLFKRNSNKRKPTSTRRTSSFVHIHKPAQENEHNFDPHSHPYADVLEKIKGNSRVQVKRGGTVLVTETFSNMNKIESSSSISSSNGSDDAGPSQTKTDGIGNTPVATDQQYKRDGNDPVEGKLIIDKNKKSRFAVHHPIADTDLQFELSIASTNSNSDMDSVLSSPSRQRLLPDNVVTTVDNSDKPVMATSRFTLNSIPLPQSKIADPVEMQSVVSSVIENNNMSKEATESVSTDEDDGRLKEVVVVNGTTNPSTSDRQLIES